MSKKERKKYININIFNIFILNILNKKLIKLKFFLNKIIELKKN